MYELNQCIDVPDNRDWKFSEYLQFDEFAQGNNLIWLEDVVKIQNQGSVGACTDFGITHISNGYNVKEWKDNGQEYTQLDAMTLWNAGNKIPSLQAALKRHKERGLIDGWLRIDGKSIDEMNNQIDKALTELGKLIYTGNSNGDWATTKKTKILSFRTDGKYVGHSWDIVKPVEYQLKKMYKCPNSWGEKWGDKGYFYLNPEHILKIYTKYVIIDHDDSDTFKYFKSLQYAKELLRLAKKMYPESPSEVQRFFDKIQLGKFLETYYKFNESNLG